MKDNMSRLVLCLAALDLTDQDLRRLLHELRSIPREELLSRISILREDAKQRNVDDQPLRSPKKSTGEFRDTSVGERVERLLKVEAGLTTLQAVSKLAMRLAEENLLDRGDMPTLSRKSLRDWINRLERRVPAKEILRCATIIRNEYVSSPARDWMLS